MIFSQPRKSYYQAKQADKYRALGIDCLATAQINYQCQIYPAKRGSQSDLKIKAPPATSIPSSNSCSTLQNSETSSYNYHYAYQIVNSDRQLRDCVRICQSRQTQFPSWFSKTVFGDVTMWQEGRGNRVSPKSFWVGEGIAYLATRLTVSYANNLWHYITSIIRYRVSRSNSFSVQRHYCPI